MACPRPTAASRPRPRTSGSTSRPGLAGHRLLPGRRRRSDRGRRVEGHRARPSSGNPSPVGAAPPRSICSIRHACRSTSPATCASPSATTPASSTCCSGSAAYRTSSTWTAWSGPAGGGASRSRASCWPTSGWPDCVGNVLIADHPEIATYLRGTSEGGGSPRSPTAPMRSTTPRPQPLPTRAGARRLRHGRSAGRSPRTPSGDRHGVVAAPRASRWWCSGPSPTRTRTTRRSGRRQRRGRVPRRDLRPARSSRRCGSTAALYLHGHTVGGTNPSLVEAMAAGNAVVAHDNVQPVGRRRRATATSAIPTTWPSCSTMLVDDRSSRRPCGQASRARFADEFTWDHIGDQYEERCSQRYWSRHGRQTPLGRARSADDRVAVVGLGQDGSLPPVDRSVRIRTSSSSASATRPATCSTCSAKYTGVPTYQRLRRDARRGRPRRGDHRDPDAPARPDGRAGARPRAPRLLREAVRARSRRGPRAWSSWRHDAGPGHPGRLPQPVRRLLPAR